MCQIIVINVVFRNQESGIRNQESGIRNQESGIKNQESRIRNQESGIRNQESGIRNQESGIRNQESRIRNQESRHYILNVKILQIKVLPESIETFKIWNHLVFHQKKAFFFLQRILRHTGKEQHSRFASPDP